MSQQPRTLGGYVSAEPLGVGFYGAISRAYGPSGRGEHRMLFVEPSLAADRNFTEALLVHGPGLRRLEHPSLVATRAVGYTEDGALAVVTDTVSGPLAVHDVFGEARRVGGKLPAEIAASVAASVLAALSAAHTAGVIHGALHPRSVLVTFDGQIKVADFAVGRALATAMARGGDASLTKGFAGFLAPELALGDDPGPACDVYAVGVLLFLMLAGEMPPGQLHATAALERLVQRAIDTDVNRRFRDAIELEENLIEALEDDVWTRATATQVSRFVGDLRASADANLDAATEDLLATIGTVPSGPPVRATPAARAALRGEDLEAPGLGELGLPPETLVSPTPLPGRRRAAVGADSGSLDALISDLDGGLDVGDDDAHTHVDPTLERDPLSGLITLDGSRDAIAAAEANKRARLPLAADAPEPARRSSQADVTPLPRPRAAHEDPGSVTRDAEQLLSGTGRGQAAERAALAALDSLDDADVLDDAGTDARRDVRPAGQTRAAAGTPRNRPAGPDPLELAAALEPPRRRALSSLFWILLGLGALGATVWVVRKQSQTTSAQEQKQKEAAEWRTKEEARLRAASKAIPGAITVGSVPDGAAVWLSLGRTPVESIELSSAQLHELRFERDGYLPTDVRVVAGNWAQGEGGERQIATISATLTAGTPSGPAPAAPLEPPPGDREGFATRQGKGVLRLESQPPGAQVWLLIGFTPGVAMDTEAKRGYELRVVKDGYLPGSAVVLDADWGTGGELAVHRDVTLIKDPGAGKRRGKGAPKNKRP